MLMAGLHLGEMVMEWRIVLFFAVRYKLEAEIF
jgi:hypothetical protein